MRATRTLRQPSFDPGRIDLGNPDEVRNWTLALSITRTQLERAVKAVGPQIEAVREFLVRRSA